MCCPSPILRAIISRLGITNIFPRHWNTVGFDALSTVIFGSNNPKSGPKVRKPAFTLMTAAEKVSKGRVKTTGIRYSVRARYARQGKKDQEDSMSHPSRSYNQLSPAQVPRSGLPSFVSVSTDSPFFSGLLKCTFIDSQLSALYSFCTFRHWFRPHSVTPTMNELSNMNAMLPSPTFTGLSSALDAFSKVSISGP